MPSINACILGGGGGTSNLMHILNPLLNKSISKLVGIISISDDGGSTGVLKNAYKTTSFGDVGKVLMETSNPGNNSALTTFNNALKFRFNDGPLKGHTVRNILMTALELICREGNSNNDNNNTKHSCTLQAMEEILHIPRNIEVLPITNKSCTVVLNDKHGEKLTNGQYETSLFKLQELENNSKKNFKVILEQSEGSCVCDTHVSDAARNIILGSDLLIVAPGHTHGSILPTLAAVGLKEIMRDFKRSGGQIVFMIPIFNRISISQMNNWKASDYVEVYTQYIGFIPDFVVMHKYVKHPVYSGKEEFQWVEPNLEPSEYAIVVDIAVLNDTVKNNSDVIVRSPAYMNPSVIQRVFNDIIEQIV